MMKDKRYERVTCKSGYSVSIQAGADKYSEPRSAEEGTVYNEVELGFPNRSDFLIDKYAEDPSRPRDTVYAYVPSRTVYLLLTKHGGVEQGEVPLGIPVYGGKSFG